MGGVCNQDEESDDAEEDDDGARDEEGPAPGITAALATSPEGGQHSAQDVAH